MKNEILNMENARSSTRRYKYTEIISFISLVRKHKTEAESFSFISLDSYHYSIFVLS